MGQNVKLMHPNEINITIDYDIQRENIHVIILSIKCFSLAMCKCLSILKIIVIIVVNTFINTLLSTINTDQLSTLDRAERGEGR